MSGAATAARPSTDGLLNIPCTAINGRVVLDDVEYTRRCIERDRHETVGVPHVWSSWMPTGRTITEEPDVELEF